MLHERFSKQRYRLGEVYKKLLKDGILDRIDSEFPVESQLNNPIPYDNLLGQVLDMNIRL